MSLLAVLLIGIGLLLVGLGLGHLVGSRRHFRQLARLLADEAQDWLDRRATA